MKSRATRKGEKPIMSEDEADHHLSTHHHTNDGAHEGSTSLNPGDTSPSTPSKQQRSSRRRQSIARLVNEAEDYVRQRDVDEEVLRTPLRPASRSRRSLLDIPLTDGNATPSSPGEAGVAPSFFGGFGSDTACPAGITDPASAECPHTMSTLRERRRGSTSSSVGSPNSVDSTTQSRNGSKTRRRSISVQRDRFRNADVDIDEDIDYNDYCPVHTHGRIDNVYHDLPRYLQDNQHIHTGYRVRLSFWQATKSLFQLHNDLFNVWSHLLGCIAMAFLLYLIISQQPHGIDFAYQHAIGRDYINQKLGFLTRFFLSPAQQYEQEQFFFQHLNFTTNLPSDTATIADFSDSGEGINGEQVKRRQSPLYIGYHETHPAYCASYYERYEIYARQFRLKQGYTPPPGAKISASLLRTTHSIDNPWDNTVNVLPLETLPLQCRSLSKATVRMAANDEQSNIVLPLELNKNLITATRRLFETFEPQLQFQLKLLKYRTKQVFSKIPIFDSIDTDTLLSIVQTTTLRNDDGHQQATEVKCGNDHDANTSNNVKETANGDECEAAKKNQRLESHVRVVFNENKEWASSILDDLELAVLNARDPVSDVNQFNTPQVQQKIRELYIGLLRFVAPVVNALDETQHVSANHTRDGLLALTNGLTHPVYFFKYFDLGEEFIDQLAVWPIVVFIISAIICFSCSALFHLFSPTNFRMHRIFSRLDYAGISILIGGSNIPIIYYTFYCNEFERSLYITCMTIGSLLTFYVTVSPAFAGTRYRAARTALFIGLGVAGVAPFIHFTMLRHFDPILLLYLVIMGATYISGAVVYVTQVPESCAPGKFDLCCASHSIWHIFVLVATFVHYLGVMYTYNSRTMSVCMDEITTHIPTLFGQ